MAASQRRRRPLFAALSAVLILFLGMPGFGLGTAGAAESADLDQCANGGVGDPPVQCTGAAWVNGNLNHNQAHYLEGESVPYRMKFGDLVVAGTNSLTIEWDTTKSGKHALDYITTYNRTETDAVPTSGTSLDPAVFTTFPIPADTTMQAQPNWTGTQAAGVFTLWGGTITAVSGYTYSGSFAADSSASITITFTSDVANPVLAWGGHIASRQDWGEDNAAIAISGSPFHMRLIDLNGKRGGQDRSLSSEAVIFPGSITIAKDALPDATTSFPFTASAGLLPATFSLVDDGAGPGVATQSYSNLTTFGTYTVSEGVVAGWTLSALSCDDTGSSTSLATRTATIDLDEGENITCTFTNTRNASITVAKTADPVSVNESGGSVTFAVTVTNDSAVSSVTITSLNDSVYGDITAVSSTVTATTCSVSQTIAAGGTYSCSFTALVTGDAGSTHTNTVTASGTDSLGNPVSDSDDATVNITDVIPTIEVTKTPNPTSVPEPGADVTFTFEVKNTSSDESVIITSLSDDVYGTLAGDADCEVGTVLAAGASCSFSITKQLAGDASGPDHQNTFTAKAVDNEENEATDADDATVVFTDVKPQINVVKTPSATTVRAGEAVTYTYTVTNPGIEPLLTVIVSDDKCGPATFVSGDTNGDKALDPTETWTYTCTTALTGTTINVVTVTGSDNDGNKVNDTDTAQVVVVNPRIVIDKTASTATATSGQAVTFTYVVTNPGDDAITSVAVTDDKCSPVAYQSGDTDGDNALDPGESWTYTCTAAMPDVDDTVTNVATVSGVDRLGGTVSATDTASVDVQRLAVLGVVVDRTGLVARTGLDTITYVAFAIALLTLGGVALWASRRRLTH